MCADCYKKQPARSCPFCNGKLIPVPRDIFDEIDMVSPNSPSLLLKNVIRNYIPISRKQSKISVKSIPKDIFSDIKSIRSQWSIDNFKSITRSYLDFRKLEKNVTVNEQKVVDAIITLHEVEEVSEIPIQRLSWISGINDLNLTYEILTRLISKQIINGYIETKGTYGDIKDDLLCLSANTFHCEITDEEYPISEPHYKCSVCFRAISSAAYEQMTSQGFSNCLYCGGKMVFYPGE